jgi:hypothetical protein
VTALARFPNASFSFILFLIFFQQYPEDKPLWYKNVPILLLRFSKAQTGFESNKRGSKGACSDLEGIGAVWTPPTLLLEFVDYKKSPK